MHADRAAVVRAAFAHFQAQDREAAERLYADDFVFTSPQDDHLDKAAFFATCFPTAGNFVEQTLLHVTPADGDDVFVLYEYELRDGTRWRNAEVLTVRDGRVAEAQVFFGGRVG